jgi:hypothetical protein
MKHLLLFIHSLPPLRLHDLYYLTAVVCFSVTCEHKQLMPAKEYVSLSTKTTKERIKNILFTASKNEEKIPFLKVSSFCIFLKTDLKVFTPKFQQITSVNSVIYPACFYHSIKRLPFFRAVLHAYGASQKNINFNIDIYEHFHNLRSLIEHAAQLDMVKNGSEV